MKKIKVFIDGESGTVGLKIRSRLENRTDIELLIISPELSEDKNERKKFLNEADIVFLCLPDDIAREAVSLIENPDVRIIDASTAHRTNPEWDYGFPELSPEQYEKIRVSKRVANPGCYASGFIALVEPLVKAGVIAKDKSISCFGISGYSGAGKAFIEEYENVGRNPELSGARLYALSQSHKHQPEMQMICGLEKTPMFNPVIDDYFSGMIVCVPLQIQASAESIKNIYKNHYSGKNSRIKLMDSDGISFLAANTLSGSDDMELYVFGDGDKILLTARFDNLGKGASGAAVQCFDIMTGANSP
ncbi:MAG: N-acetyl-gamma-glutamyl-phosphate reductase [Oscillospiraceae bacterium]|jgi:N-acetyl-gamma-glutamyl-phosphate reductase|nr:N-acetyl-gamma-glutamyl-phosphate reductase [Oscillospiraceae bacterium]